MRSISWFPVATDEELHDYAREIWSKSEDRICFVPNVFRAYAWRGDRFSRWSGHFTSLYNATNRMVMAAGFVPNDCYHHSAR